MIKVLFLIFTISLSMLSWAQDTVTEIPLTQDEIDALLNNDTSSPSTNNDSDSTISDSSQASTEAPNTGSDNTDEIPISENEDETSESGNIINNTTTTAVSAVSQAATARSIYNEYQIKKRIGNSIEGLLERRGFNRAIGGSNNWTNKNLELLKNAQKKRSFSRKFKAFGIAGIAMGTLGYLYLNFDLEESDEISGCNDLQNTNQTELIDEDTLDLINNLDID